MLSKNQIKEIQSLQIKKHRDAKKKFVAEGLKTVLEVAGHRPEVVRDVYAVKEFIEKHGADLKKNKIDIHEVSETELKKISLQVTPNQVLAVCSYFDESTNKVPSSSASSFY